MQSNSLEALQVRQAVENGAILYKGGFIGRSEVGGSQFWAAENPLTTENYAMRYGIPPENAQFDFVLTGKLTAGSRFVTRVSPGVGPNVGGGVEVVVEPHGVDISGFYMP